MNPETREKYLRLVVRVFGVTFLLAYPIRLGWPSGWIWYGGEVSIAFR